MNYVWAFIGMVLQLFVLFLILSNIGSEKKGEKTMHQELQQH